MIRRSSHRLIALGIFVALTLSMPIGATAASPSAPQPEFIPGATQAQNEVAAALVAVEVPKGRSFGFAVDPDTGVVDVEGTVPAQAFDAIKAGHPGLVTYTQVTDAGRLSRDADAAPHNGGASMIGPVAGGVSLCTSGFSVSKGGLHYLVTAGHCWGLGADIKGGNGASFGEVDWRLPFPTFDLELVGGSTYDGWAYTGNEVGVQKRVGFAADPQLGGVYCSSGTVSAEHCNHQVNHLNASFCDDAGCTPGLFRFTNGNLLAGGDSGGPIYFKLADGTLSVRGVIIAKSGTNGYGHKWSTVRDRFSASIVVG